jgi:hypothetical protein
VNNWKFSCIGKLGSAHLCFIPAQGPPSQSDRAVCMPHCRLIAAIAAPMVLTCVHRFSPRTCTAASVLSQRALIPSQSYSMMPRPFSPPRSSLGTASAPYRLYLSTHAAATPMSPVLPRLKHQRRSPHAPTRHL